MTFRWKQNPINEIRENPGYTEFNPMQPQPLQLQTVGLRGNETWRTQYDMPMTQRAPYMDAYEATPVEPPVNEELAKLQARLAEVNARIAEIDAKYPDLKNGSAAWEIAAKRAEVGDMSAYDTMMGRANAANGAVSGIENELYNAHKLLYGLSAQNDYEQGAFANQIETALRRAEEWSARNPNAKMPPIYADLKAKYDEWKAKKGVAPEAPGGFEVNNAEKTVNQMTSKIKAKTYSRADEKAIQKWIDDNPNNPATKTLQEFLDAHRADTVESRKEAADWKKWRDNKALEFEAMNPQEQDAAYKKLTKKEQAELRKVMTWTTDKNTGENYLKRKV